MKGILACAAVILPSGPMHAESPAIEKHPQAKVVVIPIRAEIANPELYILRRGLKEAIDRKVDTIVLDIDTPGGRIDITFEMLKAMEKFPGKTVAYVNREAISAGALISAGTDDIYFSPGGVIGAAAPVNADGQDIEETMRKKVISYLKARVRSVSEGKRYRADVISAMIDADFEFKIGDEVIKPKGPLLSLTAQEAVKTYGDPPHPLLGAGIAENLDELLNGIHGSGNYSATYLKITWSERLAQYLVMLSPILVGLGMLCLFIEFKTPGFGVFGISGIVLLGVVFFGQYMAGLSGHEPALFFLLGLLLLTVEIFFFPGTMIPALTGATLILGSLVWAMIDLWPGEPITITGDTLFRPLVNVMSGIIIAVLVFLAIIKFLPKGGPWGGMILETSVGGDPGGIRPLNSDPTVYADAASVIGMTGVAATALFPSGQVMIAGKRYEAKIEVGFAEAGTPVKVTGQAEFGLIVEVVS